jgi:hypothetical protein
MSGVISAAVLVAVAVVIAGLCGYLVRRLLRGRR